MTKKNDNEEYKQKVENLTKKIQGIVKENEEAKKNSEPTIAKRTTGNSSVIQPTKDVIVHDNSWVHDNNAQNKIKEALNEAGYDQDKSFKVAGDLLHAGQNTKIRDLGKAVSNALDPKATIKTEEGLQKFVHVQLEGKSGTIDKKARGVMIKNIKEKLEEMGYKNDKSLDLARNLLDNQAKEEKREFKFNVVRSIRNLFGGPSKSVKSEANRVIPVNKDKGKGQGRG